MADDFSPAPGKYKAMRWTGDNTAEFKAWVQALTHSHTFTDDEWVERTGYGPGSLDNGLMVNWVVDPWHSLRMSVVQGWWAVFGPYWGDDPAASWVPGNLWWGSTPPVSDYPWEQFSPEQFAARFGPAPGGGV